MGRGSHGDLAADAAACVHLPLLLLLALSRLLGALLLLGRRRGLLLLIQTFAYRAVNNSE